MIWYIANSAQVHFGPPKDAFNYINAAKGEMLRVYDGISLAATNVIASKLGIISKNPRVLLKVDKELRA